MEASGAKRRLAAILIADVAGYSRLMQQDDRATLAALGERRKLFAEAVAARRGRIVNAPGDSILAEFGAVIDAVEAAVDIQRACTADGQPMQFRMGVHLGDVLVDDTGAIYGDGVNIAARLEALAVPGSVCVSKSVQEQVQGRLRLAFEDLGETAVKNIAAPVHVYRIGGAARAAPESAPRQNSIAVLAFDNMTGDPAQELFCDGICEDIITDLAKTTSIMVIGRQSSFAYKGKARDLRAVGRELGVRYVLEGSVRRAGNTVRISAQLIEAEKGTPIWANRYDRALDDVFLVGDEVTEDIVTALDVKLSHGEEVRIFRQAMRVPAAREAFNAGVQAIYRGTLADVRHARDLFLEAGRLEPDSPWPFAQGAIAGCIEVMNGWAGDQRRSLDEARRLALRSCELGEGVPGAHAALGIVALYDDRHEAALEELGRAHSLRPMCSAPKAFLSYGQLYCGQWESSARNAAEAVKLNPMYPLWYRYLMGAARYFGKRVDEALPILSSVKSANPRLIQARLAIVSAELALGREEDAKAEAAAILKERPDFSVSWFAATQPFRDKALRERYLASLREAGLPA